MELYFEHNLSIFTLLTLANLRELSRRIQTNCPMSFGEIQKNKTDTASGLIRPKKLTSGGNFSIP